MRLIDKSIGHVDYDKKVDSPAARQGNKAFTLVELLAVIGVIALLTGVLIPVFTSVRENGRRTICTSNMKHLGAALLIYCQDNDEQGPDSTLSPKITHTVIPIAVGWAGRVYPYVKEVGVYHCPNDPTRLKKDTTKTDAQPVSYGMNSNLSLTPHLAAFAASAKTVWLFEVVGNNARIQETNEGAPDLSSTDELSAIADGTNGGILDVVQTASPKDRTQYATGKMDNADAFASSGTDDYQIQPSRHRAGANYLAADGHAVYLNPERVSAGGTAKNESNPQTSTGCAALNPAFTTLPCAEGTSVGSHSLTFSVR